MWRLRACLLALLLVMASPSTADEENETSEATTWTAPHLEGSSDADLLKWALAHSEPDELRRQAELLSHQPRSEQIEQMRANVQELLELTRRKPSEQNMLVEAVEVAGKAWHPAEARLAALGALRQLAERIENADELQKQAAFPAVLHLLGGGPPALRVAAARLLATAASNNLPFQVRLLEEQPQVLGNLLAMLRGESDDPDGAAAETAGADGPATASTTAASASSSGDPDGAGAALYALSALLRGSDAARHAFYAADGMPALGSLLVAEGAAAGGDASGRTLRALGLLTDLLALSGPDAPPRGLDGAGAARVALGVLQAATDLRRAAGAIDGDAAEKALLALEALAAAPGGKLGGAGAVIVLAAVGERLATAAAAPGTSPDERDFLQDLRALAGRVKAAAAAKRSARRDEL